MESTTLPLTRTRQLLFIADGCWRHVLCLFQPLFATPVTCAQRGQEMWEEDSTFSIEEVRMVRSPHEHPLDFLRVDRHDCVWLPTLVNSIGKYDFHHPEPDVAEEEEQEATRMSWKQIVQFLKRWDPFIHYSTWLRQLDLAMNDVVTAHKC